MSEEKRRYKRFRTDGEVSGRMVLVKIIEIIDISLGGIAFKTDRKLNFGREYLVKLEWKEKRLAVQGNVVSSELIGIESDEKGEGVAIYRVGLMFKDPSSSAISDFINSIEKVAKESLSVSVDQRLNVRFQIITPFERTLTYPAQFTVQVISLSGMLIQTEEELNTESMIPMELSVQDDKHISFVGRVASCRAVEGAERPRFEIGVEFKDLTDADKELLSTLIDYLT